MPIKDKDWSKMLKAYDRIMQDEVIKTNKAGKTVAGKKMLVNEQDAEKMKYEELE